MKIGVSTFPTAYTMAPMALASAVEDRGFESLWVAEHSHIPASRATPWGGGAELPQVYYDSHAPFLWLTAAACASEKLRLGTCVATVTQRDPIHTAKEVATLDVISGGRFELGVGAGWNIEEMVNHGVDPDRRLGRLRETVAAMRQIWKDEVASYHGDQIAFDDMFCKPKPVQEGGPPVLLGGGFPGGARRTVSYGNGWMPIANRIDIDEFTGWIRGFEEMCDAAGRAREEFNISACGVEPDVKDIEDLRSLGIDRAIISIPPVPDDSVLRKLDRWTALIE